MANRRRLLASAAYMPADRLTEKGGAVSVKPIPFRKSEWPAGLEAVQVTPLDAAGKPRDPRAAVVKDIRNVEYFEAMALADAEALVKQKAEGQAALGCPVNTAAGPCR